MGNDRAAAEKDWLVMLYVAADECGEHGRGPLGVESDKMLDRLKDVELAPNVNVVALRGGKSGAIADAQHAPSILVRKQGQGWQDAAATDAQAQALFLADEQGHPELDTSDHRTLAGFIRWALAKYPAKHTMLSIIGHAGGLALTLALVPLPVKGGGHSPSLLGLCPDKARMTAISVPELGRAFAAGLEDKRNKQDNARLDVVFLDACLMGMVEIGYEIREHAGYLIAGENLFSFGRNGDGLPYDSYLSLLKANPAPETLAEQIVESYNASAEQRAWAIAALKTERLAGLKDQIRALAIALKAAIGSDGAVRDAIYTAYSRSQKLDQNADGLIDAKREGYVDLFDFAYNLRQQLGASPRHETIREIARAIMHTIGERRRSVAVVDQNGTARPCTPQQRIIGSPDPGVVVRAHSQSDAQSLDNAYGLSIYLPLGSAHEQGAGASGEQASYLAYYTDPDQLRFTRDVPEWASLLVELTSGAAPQLAA